MQKNLEVRAGSVEGFWDRVVRREGEEGVGPGNGCNLL